MKNNIKGAIFDFDGTLADSMYVWDNMGEKFLETRGIPPKGSLDRILCRMSMEQAAEYLISEYNLPDSPDSIIDEINAFMANDYTEKICLKSGALDMLRAFSDNGVKMCVATANVKESVVSCLRRNGALNFFSTILTCRDVNCGKDCPDLFLRAWATLETEICDTYVFEDSLHALKTAKAAGFPVVAVYDRFSEEKLSEIKETADLFLPSFEDWEKII